MNTLAIDIGGTKLAAALIDQHLQILDRRQLTTPASKTAEALAAALSELILSLSSQAQQIAIASTGIINQGVLTAINPSNLGGLAQFALVDFVQQLSKLPCIAVNDAQAAAWAEYQALAPEMQDMVFVTVSTGVGGGIICNGKLHSGLGGLAGHVGHTLADPNGPVCGCGRIGCVEAIASGLAIAALAKDELAGLDARAIFALAAQQHSQAQALVNYSAQTMARLIADIKASTDCQCVVIGGSVGLAPGYIELIEHYLAEQPAAYRVALQPAKYQHVAGLLGAALLAQQTAS